VARLRQPRSLPNSPSAVHLVALVQEAMTSTLVCKNIAAVKEHMIAILISC
jgi:hypothetical protein